MIIERYVRKLLAWCPKESLRRSIKVRGIVASKMRKVAFMGLFLMSLPIGLLLLSAIPVTRIDTVIDVSFVLEPDEKYETAHHTGVLARRSVLKGVVSGGGIYLTVKNGYETQGLKSIYIDCRYDFTIEAIASERITFAFDNAEGDAESSVRFLLKEEWTESLFSLGVIFGGYSSILLAPIGLTLLIVGYCKSSDRTAT